jgi:hypothetical protein
MPKDWRENLKFKIKKLEKGDTFYTYDGYKNHIIDFVKDDSDGTTLIVYKCWLKHKGFWGYYCKEPEFILAEICALYNLSREDRLKLFEVNEVDPKGWIVF